MSTVNISKFKFRRGTDDQRKMVILDQGEPAYTVDTKRVYIGTGTLSGGFVVGSKVHPILLNYFSLSTVNAEVGDLVNANNKYYQLTAANYSNIESWADVSAKLDSNFLTYNANNNITLAIGSISAVYLNTNSIGSGLKVDSGILQLDYSTSSLEISANHLAIKASGITERDISTSALTYGLVGGSGTKLQVDVDPTYFVFNGNQLSLSASPTTFTLAFSSLQSTWFDFGLTYDIGLEKIYPNLYSNTIVLNGGQIAVNPVMFADGLTYDTSSDTVSATLTDVNFTLSRSSTGIVSLSDINASASAEWPKITVDQYGRVTETETSILDVFTCDSSAGGDFNNTTSLSTIFNGSPTGIYTPVDAGMGTITKFTALSSNGTGTDIIELSSGGFIVFEGNYQTRGGTNATVTRFAIPIFRF